MPPSDKDKARESLEVLLDQIFDKAWEQATSAIEGGEPYSDLFRVFITKDNISIQVPPPLRLGVGRRL